jgi:hypothetical protein
LVEAQDQRIAQLVQRLARYEDAEGRLRRILARWAS